MCANFIFDVGNQLNERVASIDGHLFGEKVA